MYEIEGDELKLKLVNSNLQVFTKEEDQVATKVAFFTLYQKKMPSLSFLKQAGTECSSSI